MLRENKLNTQTIPNKHFNKALIFIARKMSNIMMNFYCRRGEKKKEKVR